MRKIKLSLKNQARSRMTRSLLSSLIIHGQVETTLPKAKLLKREMESLASRLNNSKDLARAKICNEVLYGPAVEKAQNEAYGQVGVYRTTKRFGDNAALARVILEIKVGESTDKPIGKIAKKTESKSSNKKAKDGESK